METKSVAAFAFATGAAAAGVIAYSLLSKKHNHKKRLSDSKIRLIYLGEVPVFMNRVGAWYPTIYPLLPHRREISGGADSPRIVHCWHRV